MSQRNTSPSIDENSSSNDVEEKLTTADEKTGWANFNAFENPSNQTDQTHSISTASQNDDEWADFECSTTQHSVEQLNDTEDDNTFGDYGEVKITANSQMPTQSMNPLSTEQIAALISTCFPLQPSQTSTDADPSVSLALTSFTTFKDQRRQLPCFEHSLSLWKVLSNISNDPLGIKYQWRRSNTEHLFHQALGIHEPSQTETTPCVAEPLPFSIENTNKSSSPIIVSHSVANGNDQDLSRLDDNSRSEQTLSMDGEDEPIISPVVVHQNSYSVLSTRPGSIKTIDLFPGSTTTLNDDRKPAIDSGPSFRFIDPRALMS